jgi:hypothetical protein
MRTEELRRELQELALEMEPFAGDQQHIRRSVRMRRLAGTASALALVVVLASAAVVIHHRATLNASR